MKYFSALANMIPRYTSPPLLETYNINVLCLHLTVEIIQSNYLH